MHVLSCCRPAGDKILAPSQLPPKAKLRCSRYFMLAVSLTTLRYCFYAYGTDVEGKGPDNRSVMAYHFVLPP